MTTMRIFTGGVFAIMLAVFAIMTYAAQANETARQEIEIVQADLEAAGIPFVVLSGEDLDEFATYMSEMHGWPEKSPAITSIVIPIYPLPLGDQSVFMLILFGEGGKYLGEAYAPVEFINAFMLEGSGR